MTDLIAAVMNGMFDGMWSFVHVQSGRVPTCR